MQRHVFHNIRGFCLTGNVLGNGCELFFTWCSCINCPVLISAGTNDKIWFTCFISPIQESAADKRDDFILVPLPAARSVPLLLQTGAL